LAIICPRSEKTGQITGGSYEAKTNYKDKENTCLSICKPQIITGVNNVVKATDLATRCLFLKLEEIPRNMRKGDEYMERCFNAYHPEILGRLLYVAHKGLANGDHVEVGEVRMIDFERIVKKCEKFYAAKGDTFSKSNKVANTAVQEETLAGELTFQCMLDVMKPSGEHYVWGAGRCQELYHDMQLKQCGWSNSKDGHFPASHSALSRWLNAQSEPLKAIGCNVDQKRDKSGAWLTIRTLRGVCECGSVTMGGGAEPNGLGQ
jgi:hypothetical protein